MGFENPFKPRPRPQEQARELNPGEIEAAQISIEGAVRANLGQEKIDTGSDLTNDELGEATLAQRASMRELGQEGYREREKLLEDQAPALQGQYEALKMRRESLAPQQREILESIEKALERRGETSESYALATFVYKSCATDYGSLYRPSSTLELFSPEVQKAFNEYFAEAQIRGAQHRVLQKRGEDLESLAKEQN